MMEEQDRDMIERTKFMFDITAKESREIHEMTGKWNDELHIQMKTIFFIARKRGAVLTKAKHG